jgi:hypothetical protein
VDRGEFGRSRIGSGLDNGFDPELGAKVPRSHNTHFNDEMILVPMMDEIEKYRRYAAECRRLAEKNSAKDKAILLEIAAAWIACSEGADRSSAEQTTAKRPPSP